MAATTAAPAATNERAVLRQLTLIQAKRYARHPLFVIGIFLMLWELAASYDDWPNNEAQFNITIGVAFSVGLLGLVIAYRLVRTEDRALSVLQAAPLSTVDRTLATVAALWVPVLAGAIYMALFWASALASTPSDVAIDALGGWDGVIAWGLGHGVVCSFGGPALGIALARWVRFPGAGVIAAVGLFTLSMTMIVTSTLIPGPGENGVVRAIATAMPYTDWFIQSCDPEPCLVVGAREGSILGHLLYTVVLCGLAVWAAVIKDAHGPDRRRWTRIGWALAAAAVVTYLWAFLG